MNDNKKITVSTPVSLSKSDNKEDHIRIGIIAWMINQQKNWELRIPLGELLDIINGMGNIEGFIDKNSNEFVLKLGRLHTSDSHIVDIKQTSLSHRRIKNLLNDNQ